MENIEQKLIPIYIMGKKYMVPESLTIITAMEYVGYQFKKGIGCREGFCGACATIYRIGSDYKLRTGLACQTVVQPEMYLVQIPFSPAKKPSYDIEKLKPDVSTIQEFYPETFRCVSCNTCTKACPQELEVMDYIQATIRGDFKLVVDLSFDCIMCGLCAVRCPAEMVHYNISLLVRRLYGRYLSPRSQFLPIRIKEIEDGKYDKDMEEMKHMSREELEKRYKERDLNFKIT